MSEASFQFVLGLLRRIKSGREFSDGHTVQHHLELWANTSTAEAQLRLAIAIQQSLSEARDAVVYSILTEEAKSGLFDTINGLINAFSMGQFSTQLRSHIPAIDSSITNFAILVSRSGIEIDPVFFEERKSFIIELEEFVHSIEKYDIDEKLKDLIRREISLLIALLKNAEAVGVEPALVSYAELAIRVRNRFANGDEQQRKENSKIWDKIFSWSERLDALMKYYDAGQKLIPHIDKIPQIPGLS